MKDRCGRYSDSDRGARPGRRRPRRVWRAWIVVGGVASSLTLAAYVYGDAASMADAVREPGTALLARVIGEDGSLERIGSAVRGRITSMTDGAGLRTDRADRSVEEVDVDELIRRARRMDTLWVDVERMHDHQIAPIERVLLQYRDDPPLVRRIARALFIEAHNVEVEPRLLLAVLLVENPWLDTTIRSPVGAVGLMQVMPVHEGRWPPCEPDLEDVEANICHGARIFEHYFRAEKGDVEQALLRYNGCVRGTNTPDCHRYPYHVYARAGRASVLAWLQPELIEEEARD